MRFIPDLPREKRALARSSQLFSFICLSLVLCAFTLTSFNAEAVIKFIGANRASNVTGVGTATVVVLGGIAGTCTGTTTTTCSSCTVIDNSGSAVTDANRLKPCNDARINGNLILQLTIQSDSQATGYPTITLGSTTGTTTNNALNTNPGSVTKGNPGTIEIPWRTLCGLMTVTGGTIDGSTCELSAADTASATFTVGMKTVNDGGAFASGDDVATITVKIVKGPSADYLATLTSNGITYFEMTSGDNKGSVSKFSCPTNSGFPTGTNVQFKWVRALFEQRPDANTNVWYKINQGSPHTDLAIEGTGNCNGGITISPIAVTSGQFLSGTETKSVSIENDKVYDFKLAVVDEARNAYYYTPDGIAGAQATDTDCQLDNGTSNPSAIGGSGMYECHTIRPAVVAGVLANKVNCFIATASYGSPMAGEVDTFRHFRDTYLIPTKLGLKFVRWYYNNGPVYAHYIAQSDTYRAVARGFLWLPLQFAKISVNYGLFAGLSFLFALFAAPIALIAFALKRKRSVHA